MDSRRIELGLEKRMKKDWHGRMVQDWGSMKIVGLVEEKNRHSYLQKCQYQSEVACIPVQGNNTKGKKHRLDIKQIAEIIKLITHFTLTGASINL